MHAIDDRRGALLEKELRSFVTTLHTGRPQEI
jgi:hypothetical protein